MKALTAEWIFKAEGDFAIMQREMKVRKNPNYDGVCFHAHQCAEKYLKANLQEVGLPIEKTHNLDKLLDAIVPVFPYHELMRETVSRLNNFGISFRYPGETATKENAKIACILCVSVRDTIRMHLGCP
jgi:HEPN domain-containing protein